MIHFKTIKLTKTFYVICLLFFLGLVLSFVFIKKQPTKVIAVFSQKSTLQEPSESGLLKKKNINITTRFWQKILGQGIPLLEVVLEDDPDVDTNKFLFKLFSILTGIEPQKPFSIFQNQIPVFSTIELKQTLVPLNVSESFTPNYTSLGPQPVKPEIKKNDKSNENVPKETTEKFVLSDKPIVLIYHTHTTESYSPSKIYPYKPIDSSYHSDNPNYNMIRIGKELKKHLENDYNIKTVHETTIHDMPSYMMSYTNSFKSFKKNLEKYPSIEVALDIHRDAPFLDRVKSREETTIEIDDEKTARIMIVVGTDRIFEHPNWRKNYKFALDLKEKMDELYPGLSRKIDLREERFNQHLLDKALLVEIGSYGNTLDEALNSTKYLARCLVDVIKEYSLKGNEP